MDLIYRRATVRDIRLLTETRTEVLRAVNGLSDDTDMEDMKRQSFAYYQKALCDGTHTAYLALDQDRIAGTGGISYFQVMPTYHNPSGNKAYIMNMYTRPEYRRKGIASRILDLLVEDAKAKRISFITLEATAMGRLLYEKFGFTPMNNEMILPPDYTALSKPVSVKRVILLNGPSSSGKSTLAKALQKQIKEQRSENYEIVSIDDFLETNPAETIYEDDVYAVSGDLCKHALDILKAGSGVIIDHVITSERIFKQLKEMLHDYPLRLVRLTCSLGTLQEREEARGDRCPGSAEASAAYLFPKEGYDLTVDTDRIPLSENALMIMNKCCK